MAHDACIVRETDPRTATGQSPGVVDVIGRALVAPAQDGVLMPPVLSVDLSAANSAVDAKAAVIPATGSGRQGRTGRTGGLRSAIADLTGSGARGTAIATHVRALLQGRDVGHVFAT